MLYNFQKIIMWMLVLFLFPSLYAQTAYKVTYSIPEIKFQGSVDDMDRNQRTFLKQIEAYAEDVNYVLIATQDEAVFEQEDVLTRGNSTPLEDILFKSTQRFTSFHKILYTNHKEEQIIFIKNLVNQDFIVKRKYFDFHWVLKEESKNILGYNAKRAVGRYYDPILNKEIEVKVWFIPSIPLQSGPDIFMGLPGLIAEVELPRAIVKAKRIETNAALKIEKIDGSKAMSQEEFEGVIGKLNKRFGEVLSH